jgi:hypothetical protein
MTGYCGPDCRFAPLDASIREDCSSLDRGAWRRCFRVWNALHEKNEGIADLQTNEESPSVQLLLGHTKLESTVRYLGIEVDDALEMAEQTEV